jgi:23S rRNA pseudouridine2605 synthase
VLSGVPAVRRATVRQPGSEGFSLTAEQLEASRSERMRQNGHGTITLEDARTWIEETGLCLFLPRRQFAPAIAPTFVEAAAGERNATPEHKHIALAEDLLVRLEKDNIAVRLNLLGQPGEQPDYVVAAWVLPYVYALRGDRDWRRNPQLTGSRQVSPLAIQAYKLLEAKDEDISSLKHTLGREVTDAAVLRAITELWQQLRIIPTIAAPGEPAKWQLLRTRFQKAIAEGASTSQVTAISVLASIYLQAVIAATMEEVEVFLSSLTARSKVREVLRGLVATRQVHTISLGHAPHFYVAGTLPEFATPPTFFASASITSSYFLHPDAREQEPAEPVFHEPASLPEPVPEPVSEPVSELVLEPITAAAAPVPAPAPAPSVAAPLKPAPVAKSPNRSHFGRPVVRKHERKPATATSSRPAHRPASESRTSSARPASSRPSSGHSRSASDSRWPASAAKSGNGKPSSSRPASSGSARPAASGSSRPASSGSSHPGSKPAVRSAKPASGIRGSKPAAKPLHTGSKPVSKSGATAHKAAPSRSGSLARGSRKPAASSKTSAGKRFGYAAASRSSAKKRG